MLLDLSYLISSLLFRIAWSSRARLCEEKTSMKLYDCEAIEIEIESVEDVLKNCKNGDVP